MAEPARPEDPKPLEIAACGQPLPGHEIRIVDEAGHELGERREGRLEFRGPSTTRGYFRNETKTRELFHDGWLDSGDRAYMAGGDVCITGRIKDIIIRAGRHIYPQEVEEAVAEIPGIRKGGVAVFGVTDRQTGTERVVVLAETRETDATARAVLEARAQEVASDVAGTPPDEIVLAPPGTVPKTSSGKIRRSAAKELYSGGRIGAPQRALWRQLLRLSLAGIGPQLRRLTRLLRETLYAAWWWIVVALSFMLAWFAVMVLPRLDWRWSAMRGHCPRRFGGYRCSGCRRRSRPRPARQCDAGLQSFELHGCAAFSARFCRASLYTWPRENSPARFSPVRSCGGWACCSSSATTSAESLADTEAVIAAARQGRNIVYFPEGTFTRRPGLSGFYLGAFKIAADAGLPVLPGIIRGTRSMLRSDQWFPRWTPLSIEIEDAVKPSGTDFASLVQLRDAVRNVVLAHCGEPDLGELVKPAASADTT